MLRLVTDDDSKLICRQCFPKKIKTHIPDFHILDTEIGKDPDKRDYIVSNEKVEKTGWLPEYTIDDGIRELIKVYSFLVTNQHKNI